MPSVSCDIGIYGLAVMGQNLALNIADHGFTVGVYNRTESRTRNFMNEKGTGAAIEAAYNIQDFIDNLKKPRVILLIVKAGDAVDKVIHKLTPYLSTGDIIIDGGNSHFRDTERRTDEIGDKNIHYIGMGVSGGEEGARHGPSLMPGGSLPAYQHVEPILKAIAADYVDEPCVAYLGPRGAGHYVKMVHNGIEYAIMQAIAESYDLMRRGLSLEPHVIGSVFQRWNQGLLSSFLIEITGHILQRPDSKTKAPLIEKILDKAKQKGTGKWTTQDALDLGVPVPTISAAVEARILSAFKDEREQASEIISTSPPTISRAEDDVINVIYDALLATTATAYAQGFTLLRHASKHYDYNLNLSEVAGIWRDGCIIRAELLNPIREAYATRSDLENLLIAPYFSELLAGSELNWRECVQIGASTGIPLPAISSALNYYDSYRSARLPANIIQAQRDYFGAHTYERIDLDGQFHTEWQES